MKQVKKILLSKDIRPSIHRIKILEYLQKHKTHPSVDTIYKDLVALIPTISKVTIYNTLKLFKQKGLVLALNVSSGEETRYDAQTPSHPHFQCVRCGTLIDIHKHYPCFDTEYLESNKVLEVQLLFKGLCEKCRITKEKADKEK